MFSNSRAGMSSSTSSHHDPNLNVWSHRVVFRFQANASPQGHQRVDEVPVVPTKAKMNHALMRGSTSEFGMDSMFESSTGSGQPGADDTKMHHRRERHSKSTSTAGDHPFSFSASRRPRTPTAASSTSSTPLYVIVFGYPPDKYRVTVGYFKSFGVTTDADPNPEIVDCFRIEYRDTGDAMRAVRKNGEVLGESWMIGAKWAVSGFLSLG
ncbi:hypothetical protein K435DRAFT_860864 [Dendrothele bispora CBS 962.96]|uniref:RRM Nup35-type domain-containing protein n=1 Tax=Dendrothele bispora (strain CBS 962.96) TaxID=1314807 RepID=A0A4S8LXE8_DENBC|nr:hypothetical protein K435DRAFT_860864 [Dendrothele bispora CBS 962.96]